MSKHLSDDQLIHYVCRTLTDTQREAMDLHFGVCQACRARLAGHEALQRRVRYSIMDRRRRATISSQATFTDIAPRLRRSRRMAMFWTGSKQFLYGAATMAFLVLLAVGLILFFGGIGQSPPGPALQPLAPGTYATTITMDDCLTRDYHSPLALSLCPGKWELTLAEGNRYSITKDGNIQFHEGRYEVTQDQIVFTDKPLGDYWCPWDATYKWTFDGKALTLTTVEEPCEGRNPTLTMHPLLKQD